MSHSLLRYSIAAATLCLSLCSFDAQAKPSDPEPDGIQAGGFVIHPGADAGVSFNYENNSEYGSKKDGLVDISAHLKTHLVDEEIRSWNNEVSLKWRQFWGIGSRNPDGGINVRIATDADLLKKSIFRISPSASYTYVSEPEDENLRQDYKNHNISAGSAFIIQPGEGAIFSERISYRFNGHLYQDRSDITNFAHRIESMTRWNFLPQTSMALMIDFRITHYLEDSRGSVENSDAYENSNSYPIRIKYSFQGLLLDRLSYALGAGYAYVYYSNSLKEHMFIMNAKLKYEFNENVDISLEYRKDFETVVYGDYYKYHNVMLKFGALWFDHLKTDLDLGYSNFDYRSLDGNTRNDNLFSAQANIYYHFFPGLKLGLEYKLRYNSSDLVVADYSRHLITLNLGYEY